MYTIDKANVENTWLLHIWTHLFTTWNEEKNECFL